MRPEATGERRFRFELTAHPASVARARRLTRARLTGWALSEDTCDTAALVVSELVTNAIVHAAGERVVCELHDGDDRVRIAVRDEGCAPDTPHPSPRRPEEEHGRGLFLVEAVCRAWGAQKAGSGLLVWADLPRGCRAPLAAGGGRSAEEGVRSAEDVQLAERGRSAGVDRSVRVPRPADASPPAGVPRPAESSRPPEGARPTKTLVPRQVPRHADALHPVVPSHPTDPPRPANPAHPTGTDPHSASGAATHTAARSDLGWSAKKPPTEDRGNGSRAPRETGTEWK